MTSTESGRGPERLRPTRQRRAVMDVLESVQEFRSAQEIHALLAESVGLATVYRTLTALADAGEVDVLVGAGGEATYRRCSRDHHHHLVCRSCGSTVEIAGSAVERWAETVAAEHGFADVSHTLEIFGSCPTCH